MLVAELKKKRDELLREVKKEKSPEYKAGFFDGALDIYNIAVKLISSEDGQAVAVKRRKE